MTNNARGEVAVEINGEQFIFVSTLRAMAEIEADTGIDYRMLLSSMRSGISMKHLLACAVRFAQAGGAVDTSAIETARDVGPIAKGVAECINASMPSSGKADGGEAKT